MLSRIIGFLKCPDCSGSLELLPEGASHMRDKASRGARCFSCGRIFLKKRDALVFVETLAEKDTDTSFTFRLKEFLKARPRLFFVFYYTLGVFVGKSAKSAIKDLPNGAVILNVASGIKIIRPDVINIDIETYPGVLVSADALQLPFKDGTVDAVLCESSLEHFQNPELAIKEMLRVLKFGGTVYTSVPFICGFHASPNDYYRWTEAGVKKLFSDFEVKEIGIGWGPTYALTTILREWLALILSFNSNTFHQLLAILFTVLFAPLNFLDYIFVHFGLAKNIAYGFYFVGTKK